MKFTRRVAIVLPGLHRVSRGAEVAFESLAEGLARLPGWEVTLIGSGKERQGQAYSFRHAACVPRERFEGWPGGLPMFRSDCAYEELSFVPGLVRAYRPSDFDLTVTCSYPYTSWLLRWRRGGGKRPPAHVYVTQNGDWPAIAGNKEYRLFACDGLVCTNPDYYDRNQGRWFSALIPNGVDCAMFKPGAGDRAKLGLPIGVPLALMVSALIPSKRVVEGIRSAAKVEGLHLVVAGDGPMREDVLAEGERLMGQRFKRVGMPRSRMPGVYRCADVMLHMSLDEPSANAYVEALASGLPIVTHDRRVTQWTLEGHGVLVDACDEAAVAGGLRRALTVRSAEHVAGRRALAERRFEWARVAEAYAEFFTRVLERRRLAGVA